MTAKKPVRKAAKTSANKPAKRASRSARAQPETFRARGMSASLTVKDLQRSVAWYRDAVGFVVMKEYDRDGRPVAVRLKAGSVELLLNQDDGAKGWDRAKGEGISLYFVTAQSVDDVANRIRKAGGTLDTEPTDMPWGSRAFRVKDPDGFRFAVSTERSS